MMSFGHTIADNLVLRQSFCHRLRSNALEKSLGQLYNQEIRIRLLNLKTKRQMNAENVAEKRLIMEQPMLIYILYLTLQITIKHIHLYKVKFV